MKFRIYLLNEIIKKQEQYKPSDYKIIQHGPDRFAEFDFKVKVNGKWHRYFSNQSNIIFLKKLIKDRFSNVDVNKIKIEKRKK